MRHDDLAIDIIVDLLASHTGQFITEDRRWRIKPALSNLLRERKIDSLHELIVQLTQSDDETLAREVVEALLNNETYFFRDRGVFEQIADEVLPKLAQQRSEEKRLRIWSVGCSTGQEALSLAMCFAEQSRRWMDWNIEILATDVSHSVIDFARQGTYSNFQIQRGLGVAQMLGFFTEMPGGWQALEALKGKIHFAVHNVLDPSPWHRKFDLILCRNVLLYFDDETRGKALDRLAEALASDGRLVLGGGEMAVSESNPFETVDQRNCIYRARPMQRVAESHSGW